MSITKTTCSLGVSTPTKLPVFLLGSISLITRVEEDTAILEIVDDGPGMDSKTAERCMDVYYSSKKGGSGLGLPTVRRILEAHEGALQLESSPGHGTRARMILPIGRDS